ncbi:hypothetical protein [Streptomyces sp. NPDC060243]|uniref:hypothetical protein n=1 Tax=Streptomyces sp. NPDC060243 TaxID=3347081 RepID=UPI003651CBAF
MEPSALGVAAIRSIGKAGSAAISRYKPLGVARVGSPEDRAQAYRRMLEAAAHYQLAQTFVSATSSVSNSQHPLSVDTIRDLMTTGSELVTATLGVQLCAPEYVIDAAQKVCDALQQDEESRKGAYHHAQKAFLNAARYDLNYNPKRWEFWKKRKARRFAAQGLQRS